MSKQSDIHDARVSAAYRETATEVTPAHLDRAVLEAARAGARTRYGLARAWMRPLAWAATIALSFAFVLQLPIRDEPPMPGATEIPEGRAETFPESDDRDAVETRATPDEVPRKAKELRQPTVSQAPARFAPEPVPGSAIAAEDKVAAAAGALADAALCDAAARTSAASWYTCVEALRESGREAAADAELAALQTAFPDFRPPAD